MNLQQILLINLKDFLGEIEDKERAAQLLINTQRDIEHEITQMEQQYANLTNVLRNKVENTPYREVPRITAIDEFLMNEIAELAQRMSEFQTAVNDIKKELNDLYTTMKVQANAASRAIIEVSLLEVKQQQ